MTRKPARMYRRIEGPAYTRREYMGGVPGIRINQFEVGNRSGDFPVVMSLIVENDCQIRHTALEAARIAANRYVQKFAGVSGYHIKLRVYPHQVIRENKMATGAGADRISSGMRGAFGKPVGTAARVKVGQPVFTIRTSVAYFKAAKVALFKAAIKLPTRTHIDIEKGADLVK